MNRIRRILITLILSLSLFLIFSQAVYASVGAGTFSQSVYTHYIDPGTGSIIIQVLIGVVVAGAGMIGVYRNRVKNFFTNLFSRRGQNNEAGESKESEGSE
jgi:hypothetical protein